MICSRCRREFGMHFDPGIFVNGVRVFPCQINQVKYNEPYMDATWKEGIIPEYSTTGPLAGEQLCLEI